MYKVGFQCKTRLIFFFTYFGLSHAIPKAVITCILEIVQISDDAISWLQATF